jgi:hypothetical protein
MKKSAAILIASSLFAHYPSTDKFHITTDGQAFTDKNLAESHAISLDKKEPVVIEVTREEAEAFVPDETEAEATGTGETGEVKSNLVKKIEAVKKAQSGKTKA